MARPLRLHQQRFPVSVGAGGRNQAKPLAGVWWLVGNRAFALDSWPRANPEHLIGDRIDGNKTRLVLHAASIKPSRPLQ